MNLWCDSCNCLHHFSDAEIERIVYSLQAELHDTTLVAKQEHNADDVVAMSDELTCLQEVLDLSHSIEAWAEHVQGSVDCRKRLGQLTGGVLREHLVEGAGRR